LEVFDGIGDVNLFALNAGFLNDLIKDAASWTHKGATGKILVIAGLFADKDHARIGRALAKDGLRGVAMKRAALAGGGLSAQFLKVRRDFRQLVFRPV